jgi:hypothetical protein
MRSYLLVHAFSELASFCYGVVQMVMLARILGVSVTELKLNHHRYVTRLLTALTEYFLQVTVRAVQTSMFFGLIIDLSSDRASREHMLVYVIYWNSASMKSITKYLCCIRLVRKDAETIFNSLVDICAVLGLDMQNSDVLCRWR